MVAWMYQGLMEENAREKAGWLIKHMGSLEDKANFNSRCELRDATGNALRPSRVTPDVEGLEEFPMWVWSDMPEDCTIEWQVQTIECDDTAGSDRVEIVLNTFDYLLMAQMANDILATWETADIEFLLAEYETPSTTGAAIYETRLIDEMSAKIDTSAELGALLLPTIYSDVVQTDSEGMAEGDIPIPSYWPKSQYFLNFHYGYSGRAESSESTKFWQFLKEWGVTILELVILLVLTILLIASLLIPGAQAASMPLAVSMTLLVADLGLMVHDYLYTGFGIIDENKAGCLFPLPGFNHTYSFTFPESDIVIDAAENINMTLPLEAQEVFAEWLQADFWPKVITGGVVVGILLAAGLWAL